MENTATLSVEELEKLLATRKEEQRLLRISKVKAYEELKEQSIQELFKLATDVEGVLSSFKKEAFEKKQVMEDLLKEYTESNNEITDNYQLISKCGTKKIRFTKQAIGIFDERSKQAETMIQEFVTEKVTDVDVQALILSLLRRKNGQIDPKRVAELYKMQDNFADEKWQKGLELLKESYTIVNSKDYITFYTKSETDNSWKLINLNFSSVE